MFHVAIRGVKFPNHTNTKMFGIQFVFYKAKVISNDFRIAIREKVMVSRIEIWGQGIQCSVTMCFI
jgi:hypothetical protein